MGIHGVIISTQATSSTIHLPNSVRTSTVSLVSGSLMILEMGMWCSVGMEDKVNLEAREEPAHGTEASVDHSTRINGGRNGKNSHFPYRRPSVKTMLGVTKAKKHVKKDLEITAAMWP